MKKLFIIALCTIISMSFASCAKENQETDIRDITENPAVSQQSDTAKTENNIQIANPFTECETLEEAEKIAGLELQMPSSIPDWMNEMVFRAEKDRMVEVIIKGVNDEQIRIRKASGTDDISGDYSQYSEVSEINAGENNITLKGSDGKISLAVWHSEKFTYSVSFKDAVTQSDAELIINDIK